MIDKILELNKFIQNKINLKKKHKNTKKLINTVQLKLI